MSHAMRRNPTCSKENCDREAEKNQKKISKGFVAFDLLSQLAGCQFIHHWISIILILLPLQKFNDNNKSPRKTRRQRSKPSINKFKISERPRIASEYTWIHRPSFYHPQSRPSSSRYTCSPTQHSWWRRSTSLRLARCVSSQYSVIFLNQPLEYIDPLIQIQTTNIYGSANS